jgi:hypothetical protein
MTFVPKRAGGNLIGKFMAKLVEEGPASALRTTASFVRNQFAPVDHAHARRVELSDQLSRLLDGTVAYGPFKGLKLIDAAWWGGRADRASMLLGLYELEVLQSICTMAPERRTFVNIGAADGYYGLGVLVNQAFDRSFCFELSAMGREAIARNAALNGLADKVVICAEATKDFYNAVPAQQLRSAVVLVDIEGGEFGILNAEVFRALRHCVIFIEMHDWHFEDGEIRRRKLVNDASLFFSITELTTTGRDLSKFPELRGYSDTDRWLMCSEGRPRLMTWLRLDPLPLAREEMP